MIYNLLMAFGVVVVVGIIVKGFRGATRVKPIEQPDNWPRTQQQDSS
jgi:hypothetical protein